MKLKKRALILINLITMIALVVAIADSQNNRKLYIEERARNSLLISELNDRNATINALEHKLEAYEK